MQLEANWSVSVRLRLTTAAAAAAAAAAAPAAAAAQQRRLSLNRCACVRVCACVCVLASEQTQVSCAPFMDTLWFCFGALPSHCNHSSRCDPRHRFACGLLCSVAFPPVSALLQGRWGRQVHTTGAYLQWAKRVLCPAFFSQSLLTSCACAVQGVHSLFCDQEQNPRASQGKSYSALPLCHL